MAQGLQFEVCPETGVGCVLVERSAGALKIDLMPDETTKLQALVRAGDLEGAKALLVEVEPAAESVELQTLAEGIG